MSAPIAVEAVMPVRRWRDFPLRVALAAFVATLVLLLALGAGAVVALERATAGIVASGVSAAGVALGGLDPAAAQAELDRALPQVGAGAIALRIEGQTIEIPFESANRRFDTAATLERVMALGHSGGPLDQLAERISIAMNGAQVPVSVTYDPAALDSALDDALVGFDQSVRDARIRPVAGGWRVEPGQDGTALDMAAMRAQVHAAFADSSVDGRTIEVAVRRVEPQITTAEAQAAVDRASAIAGSGLLLADGDQSFPLTPEQVRAWLSIAVDTDGAMAVSVDEAAVAASLAGLAETVERPAIDAAFAFGTGRSIVAVPGTQGRTLDTAVTAQGVLAALEGRAASAGTVTQAAAVDQTVPLGFTPVEPRFTTAQAEAAAPRVTRVSRWTTHFVPGDNNFFGANISVPASKIDGQVVPVGRWFDFWKAIGALSRKEGYGPGAAIINGRTEPTGILAGGICSCSTTIFNAALRAGLQMGDRRNHYYYISRYPVGLDATVFKSSSGSVQSMRFRNDTAYPILIRAINGTGVVRFEIYTVPTGRTVTFSQPRIQDRESAGDTLEYTDSLAPGRTQRIQYPTAGFRVWVTRIVRDASGAVVHEDEFYSRYSAVDGITLVGRRPGDPPAGTIVYLNR